MHKSHGVKFPERCYEVHTTRVEWTADELNYWRRYWGRVDEPAKAEVAERGRAKERVEPSGKHDVVKRVDKDKRAASAAQAIERKPVDTSVSPPLKARKFERYVDEVPSWKEGTEHLLKIPEGVVREVLGGEDRGYDLPEVTAEELEMRIGWAKINDKAEVEEEVLNGVFVVPYPYVKAVEVAARPHLRKETFEATEVVEFVYESD